MTDKSPEGTQFVKGFSGLGGFLRYKIDTDHLLNNDAGEYDDEDEDFIWSWSFIVSNFGLILLSI